MSRTLKLKFRSPAADPAVRTDPVTSSEADALLSFGTESEAPVRPPAGHHPTTERPQAAKGSFAGYAWGGALLLVIAGAGAAAFVQSRSTARLTASAPAVTPTGTVTIDSRPQGAAVSVAGISRGFTPVELSLPEGEHAVELVYGGVTRALPIRVVGGAILAQHVEFAAEPVVTAGRLDVESDPAGAQVRVDGTPRGVTPLSLASIPPGEHTVTIAAGDALVTRRVTVVAGATATVVASVAASGAAAGYAAFSAPFDLQVFEGGKLVGTTEADRLMLPAGRHQLELVNADLEFRRTLNVDVAAGRTVTTQVGVPEGRVSINAQPWADVSLAGRQVGTTPLANVAVPIGRHELVFRHPDLGERRRTIVVTASTPVRVGMDMRQ